MSRMFSYLLLCVITTVVGTTSSSTLSSLRKNNRKFSFEETKTNMNERHTTRDKQSCYFLFFILETIFGAKWMKKSFQFSSLNSDKPTTSEQDTVKFYKFQPRRCSHSQKQLFNFYIHLGWCPFQTEKKLFRARSRVKFLKSSLKSSLQLSFRAKNNTKKNLEETRRLKVIKVPCHNSAAIVNLRRGWRF